MQSKYAIVHMMAGMRGMYLESRHCRQYIMNAII